MDDNKKLQYKAIEDVFQVKYYIDFYQRDYTWGSDNVNDLLEDIYYRFDIKYAPESDLTPKYIKENFKWYYLNTYIINKQGSKTCIVDGQQRFSTLTLILIKLYHLAQSRDLTQHITDSVKELICKSTPSGLQFWMGGDDRTETYKDLFKNQKNTLPDRELNDSERNLFWQYNNVSDYLEEKFNEQNSHYLECFIIYYLTNVKLVEIEIEESDDVAMVFEVINAKGKKLNSHEILKAQLLSQIPKNDLDEYLGYWHEACGKLRWLSLKYPSIDNSIDIFFTFLFRARHTKNITEILKFKDYHKTIFSREWQDRLPFKKDVKFVKNFIKTDFVYYANKMSELAENSENTYRHVYFNVSLNDIQNQYLLILTVVKPDDPLFEKKVDLISKLLDRHYVLLRLQGCYGSENFGKGISSLILKLKDKDDLVEIKQLFDTDLLTTMNDIRDTDVSELFSYNFYKNSGLSGNKKFIRYLLARIEEHICNEMDYKTFAGYSSLVNGRNYHIEHVLANNEENIEIFGNEDYFNEQRNRLGALLLLKKGDNEMSNAELYEDKLKTYANDTVFARTLTQNFYHKNSGLKKFKENFPSIDIKAIDKFDEDALNSRHKLVFELCKEIWINGKTKSN